jgi:hypothetical protein
MVRKTKETKLLEAIDLRQRETSAAWRKFGACLFALFLLGVILFAFLYVCNDLYVPATDTHKGSVVIFAIMTGVLAVGMFCSLIGWCDQIDKRYGLVKNEEA